MRAANLAVLALCLGAAGAKKPPACEAGFAGLGAGDACRAPWAQLQPSLRATQNMLGWAWVMYKHAKNMGSAADAQKEFDEKIVPVVKRGAALYVLDHHHTLAALDYAGAALAAAVQPTVHVVCDFSAEVSDAAFWAKMDAHMYAFGRPPAQPEALPSALPSPIAAAFPRTIAFNATQRSAFMDDPWRSLAGFVRKLDAAPGCVDGGDNHVYGCRAYDKVCDAAGAGMPFFEFRWGFFFNDAHVDPDQKAWGALPAAAAAAWRAAYAELPYPAAPAQVDTDTWFAAAATLFPLARSAAAGSFSVPAQFVTTAGKLPGFKAGAAPFSSGEPECAIATCSNPNPVLALPLVTTSTACPAGKFLRVSASDSVAPGGAPCGCRDNYIGPNGGCSSHCSSCACCCGSGGFVAAFSSGTYHLCLADTPAPTPAPAPTPVAVSWLNSTEGIHGFLTFDSRASAALIAAHAREADFVWGATESHVAAWRASPQPDAVLAKYIPFCRDPIAGQHQNQSGPSPPASGLPWWQANHPELVLYQCDRVTPAWECFAGEGCSHANVPLDLAQPAALAFQLEAAVRPAKAAGYSAIGLDNYGLSNSWKACGSFSGAGGAWVQRYSGATVDVQYRADVLNWTSRAVAAFHAEGLLVIPNFSDQGADGLAVGELVDGLLAEAGFAEWNPVPNTSTFDTPPPMTTPAKFARQVGFVRQLQRAGKGFFAINEWGAGPDYGLNRAEIPYNISGAAHRAIRQFVVAAYMMVNGGACGIFLTCIQCYGNFSTWPEYGAAVGHPLGEPARNATTGIWTRAYSAGIALVNPEVEPHAVTLPPGSWSDLYDAVVPATVQLPPASGLVLLKAKYM